MGIVLASNFKGQHFWIPPIPQQEKNMRYLGYSEEEINSLGIEYDKDKHGKGMVKIDAMFVPATQGETCNLLRHKKDNDNEINRIINGRYKDYDTFILCNTNANMYQKMVNQPHAYYLNFFLNRKINCLIWNYRGYGRTKGKPDPR